jgi:hypothetical protein
MEIRAPVSHLCSRRAKLGKEILKRGKHYRKKEQKANMLKNGKEN